MSRIKNYEKQIVKGIIMMCVEENLLDSIGAGYICNKVLELVYDLGVDFPDFDSLFEYATMELEKVQHS